LLLGNSHDADGITRDPGDVPDSPDLEHQA